MTEILLLLGSPHGMDGSTMRLTCAFFDSFVSGIGEWSLSIYDSYDMKAAPCTDCGACKTRDCCAFDDLNEFDKALRACDVLIIATPVYHSTFPAPLKAIIDRTQRYFYAYRRGESPFDDKKRSAVLLLTAGQEKERGEVIKEQLKWVLPTIGAELAGGMIIPGLNSAEITEEQLEQARECGVRLTAKIFGQE